MKKIWPLLLLLVFPVMMASAQVKGNLSASTKMFLQRYQSGAVRKAPAKRDRGDLQLGMAEADSHDLLPETETRGGKDYVPAFIRIANTSMDRLPALGVLVDSRFDGFVSARIPVDKLEAVAALEGVSEVSVSTVAEVETDQGRQKTGVWDAINNTSLAQGLGLQQPYTGKGVVVGIIDSGIDFNHSAFKDKDGNTRIVKALAVDMNSTGDLREYDAADISSLRTDYDGSDHGTHTSSIAGGSAVEVNGVTYGGMAPEADLVLCGLGASMTSTKIVNSLRYICDYAASVGKPCVINMSLGSQGGAHDGTGYLQEACNQLAGPGRIIVNSGGNDANHSTVGGMYLSGIASVSNPLRSVFNSHYYSNTDDNYYYNYYASAWARTPNVPIAVRVHVVDKSSSQVVWTSKEFTSEGSISSYTRGSNTSTTFGTYYGIESGGSFYIAVSRNEYNGKYNVLIDMSKVKCKEYVKENNTYKSQYAIAFSFYPTSNYASTTIDCWSNQGGYFTNNVSATGYDFVDGSNLCCSNDRAGTDSLILVGAYVTKNEITDHNGKTWSIPSYELDNYAPFSSYTVEGYGPTGCMEPTISAPGATIVSAVNHYSSTYTDDSNATAARVRVNDDAGNPYGNMSGTSMAAPCVTGIVALWLQADPTLSVADVKKLMKETAIQDEFTTDEAGKPHFGNGKVNALGGLRAILSRHRLPGDVNTDGSVTIADVTALVNILLGKYDAELHEYDYVAADVNGDGTVTIADVTALVKIILEK